MTTPKKKVEPRVGAPKKTNNSEATTTAFVLSQLKYPLVFFGLALIVVETLFGLALNQSSSQTATLVIVGCMTGLFLVAMVIVALLVWKVPTHIMLTAQVHAPTDVLEQLRRARAAALILEKWQEQPKTPDTLIHVIETIELLLKGRAPSEAQHV